jgi:hypothetical protein
MTSLVTHPSASLRVTDRFITLTGPYIFFTYVLNKIHIYQVNPPFSKKTKTPLINPLHICEFIILNKKLHN